MYGWENWDTEQSGRLPKVTWLVSVEPEPKPMWNGSRAYTLHYCSEFMMCSEGEKETSMWRVMLSPTQVSPLTQRHFTAPPPFRGPREARLSTHLLLKISYNVEKNNRLKERESN